MIARIADKDVYLRPDVLEDNNIVHGIMMDESQRDHLEYITNWIPNIYLPLVTNCERITVIWTPFSLSVGVI